MTFIMSRLLLPPCESRYLVPAWPGDVALNLNIVGIGHGSFPIFIQIEPALNIHVLSESSTTNARFPLGRILAAPYFGGGRVFEKNELMACKNKRRSAAWCMEWFPTRAVIDGVPAL